MKPTLKKLCETDPANWDKDLTQVLTSYRITPNLATAESPFFLVYGRDPNLPLHQLLEPMQHFLGDPDSGKLNLETHRLALAIAKKTLDENRFTATQKTLARNQPAFQVGDHVYFKNKQPGKWDLKWRPGYRIVHIEHDGHFIHIENQATAKIQSCNIKDIILEPASSSGILILSSAEPATILITLLIYQLYNLRIPPKQYQNEITKSSLYCIIINYHLHYSIILTLTPTMNSSQTDLGESVIFQAVLQAYLTRHSWIITAHISLRNLEHHRKPFNRQLTKTQQFLRPLDQHPSAPTQLLPTLQLELSNIQDIYNSGETTITSAIKLLQSNQPQTHIHCRRSLLPFLGDALSWLTGTATTKDIHSIKTRINQLITTQTSQHNTLVHFVSILNITRYATQVNRHSINTLMNAV